MKRASSVLLWFLSLIVAAAPAAVLHAQAPTRRLPVITGNGLVNVLVEVDGSVRTWGDPGAMDPSVSLGDGVKPSATPEVKSPRLLPGVTGVASASVGVSHALLLKRDGTILAWGDNDNCQLGNGTDKGSNAPLPVLGIRSAIQVATGEGVSATLLSDGTVWVWGDVGGLLGNGQAEKHLCVKVPVKVEGVSGVKHLAFDGASALVLRDDGTAWAWGSNVRGAFCDGTKEPRLRPAPVTAIANVVDVSLDGNSIFVLADGTVRMCGKNEDGALGDPAPGVKEHLTPFKVPGLTNVRSARTYLYTTTVQLNDGTLRAWGLGWYGALGDGHGDTFSSRPRAPIGLGPVLAHYVSRAASYAIRTDGTVMVWSVPAPPGGKTEFVLTPAPAPFNVVLEAR